VGRVTVLSKGWAGDGNFFREKAEKKGGEM
jgi:hypothetical protein